MPLPSWAVLALVALSVGCASPSMKAVADCSFKAGTKYADGVFKELWKNDPEGRCSFHLEAPIRRSSDAETFATAFDRMLSATPKPEGLGVPKMELKVKQ